VGWRAYRWEDVADGNEQPEVAIFCPFCTPLEFDWSLK
jgi:hypothetical protein